MAKQLGAEAYLECSAFTSEKSIHSVFRTAALACINKLQPLAKPSPTRRLSKRLLHLPSKSELLSSTFKKEKAKSCSVMWVENFTPPITKATPFPALWSGEGGWVPIATSLTCGILPHPPKKHLSEQVDTPLSSLSWALQQCICIFSTVSCFQTRFDHQSSSIHSLLPRDLLSLCQLKLGMIQLSK